MEQKQSWKMANEETWLNNAPCQTPSQGLTHSLHTHDKAARTYWRVSLEKKVLLALLDCYYCHGKHFNDLNINILECISCWYKCRNFSLYLTFPIWIFRVRNTTHSHWTNSDSKWLISSKIKSPSGLPHYSWNWKQKCQSTTIKAVLTVFLNWLKETGRSRNPVRDNKRQALENWIVMWPPEIPLSEAKILESASPENGLPSPGSAALLFFQTRLCKNCLRARGRRGEKQQWLLSSIKLSWKSRNYHIRLGCAPYQVPLSSH